MNFFGFILDYPWSDSDVMRSLQEWMYLPDPDSPPNSKKLICKFDKIRN